VKILTIIGFKKFCRK